MSHDHAAEKGKWQFKQKQKKEKLAKHYSSNHQILLVGEGDFSFSLSLARSFGSASNILASSLDSYDVLIKMYKEAKSNLQNLEKMGASLLHGVDATRMKLHTDLTMRKFDRIVFNFPHAGFHGKEDNAHMIKMHRDLVYGFFWNASCMLRANGEIHVNHKTTAPFCYWNIQELASHNSMALVECLDFKKEDYPGYHNKRGSGSRCDEAFPLGECSTFKFKFYHTTSTYFSYPQEGHFSNMEQISGRALLPLATNPRNQFLGMPPLPLATNPRNQSHWMPPLPLATNPINQSHWMPPLPLPTNPINQSHWMPPLPLPTNPINQFHWMFDRHVNHPTEMFGRGNYNLSSSWDTPGIHDPVPDGWE